MANLKEIRSRIASVSSNMKITQAMKLVSASKFKKASDSILAIRPYSEKLSDILAKVSQSSQTDNNGVNSPFSQKRELKKVLLVVFTSNRGLCGAFNSNIIKSVKNLIASDYKNVDIDIMTIGNKAKDSISKFHHVEYDFSDIYDNPSYSSSDEISSLIMKKFIKGKYDKVDLVYNKFKNAGTQIPSVEQFLPLESKKDDSYKTEDSSDDYIFEPDKKTIVEQIIPQSIKLAFYRTLRDSIASEHGARMTAMHKATDNAKQLKEALTLQYNKERQSAITSQLTEIIGAAESMKA